MLEAVTNNRAGEDGAIDEDTAQVPGMREVQDQPILRRSQA